VSKAILADIIHAKQPTLSKVACNALAGAVLDGMAKNILKGGFSLPGVGSLTVVKRAARQGFNPRSRQQIKIAAKKVVRFKVSSMLDGALNKASRKK
jgi:DNA-binding protein HU-beta